MGLFGLGVPVVFTYDKAASVNSDGIQNFLKQAHLERFTDAFINLSAYKTMHLIDVDDEMLSGVGLTVLEIKRLRRIFNETVCNPGTSKGNI